MHPMLGELCDTRRDVPEACGDSASSRIHRVNGDSGGVQKVLDLRLQVWEKRIRAEDVKKKLLKKDMAGNLTGSLGVGVGELAADNDLICLCPVKIAAGFIELAEEVADVVLGALI